MAFLDKYINQTAEPLSNDEADMLYQSFVFIETALCKAEAVRSMLVRKWALNEEGYQAFDSLLNRLFQLESDVTDLINILDEKDII